MQCTNLYHVRADIDRWVEVEIFSLFRDHRAISGREQAVSCMYCFIGYLISDISSQLSEWIQGR